MTRPVALSTMECMKTNLDETAQLARTALLAEYRAAVRHLGELKADALINEPSPSSECKRREALDKVFDLRIQVWDALLKKPPMTNEELNEPPWS